MIIGFVGILCCVLLGLLMLYKKVWNIIDWRVKVYFVTPIFSTISLILKNYELEEFRLTALVISFSAILVLIVFGYPGTKRSASYVNKKKMIENERILKENFNHQKRV